MDSEKTMNNEVIENEFVEKPANIVEDDGGYDCYYEPDDDGIRGKIVKVAVVGGLAVVGGIAIKQKDKIKDALRGRMIKSLEKKGYTILESDYEVIYENDEDSSDVDENEK